MQPGNGLAWTTRCAWRVWEPWSSACRRRSASAGSTDTDAVNPADCVAKALELLFTLTGAELARPETEQEASSASDYDSDD